MDVIKLKSKFSLLTTYSLAKSKKCTNNDYPISKKYFRYLFPNCICINFLSLPLHSSMHEVRKNSFIIMLYLEYGYPQL